MAGDWIKMRGALLDHPKVIAIGRELHRSKDFREWLTPGGGGPTNGQTIGDHALRCVTTALLMRMWSVAREHGKFVGDDLVLEHSELRDLDQMAGAPGVGDAMATVRWALPKNGVTLPNFKEFNVPMTAAEKQREYRMRNAKGNGVVTRTLPSEGNEKSENVTSRVEESRKDQNLLFDRFWSAYPRKEAKPKALKAFKALKLVNGDFEKVLAALEIAKKSPQWIRDGGKFIPHPASWLNGRRFEDEGTTVVGVGSTENPFTAGPGKAVM